MSTTEFQNLIVNERALLKNFALKLTMNQEDAKDLLQDTLLKALRYKDKFIESTNLKAWLCVIMKNTFINNYRRKTKANKFMTVVEDVRLINPARRFHTNEVESELNLKEINKAIDSLKDEFKIPFHRYHQGYKYKEISEELNIPIGTVKSRIFLARQEMMDKLEAFQ
jgi:RNA polymerase sigma factor (sigma-70 family)